MTKTVSTKNLPENATMANVMVAIGVFPSVTQARKNGWDKPIELGRHVLTKRKIEVMIIDTEFEEKEKAFRWDLEPGFWPNYQEPSPMAEAIQFPLNDPLWQDRVLSAYRKKVKL